ncbi:MAG: tetratricopeptide repeat protein [Mariniblastus sp.]
MKQATYKIICIIGVLAICGCSSFPVANDFMFKRLDQASSTSQDQIDLRFGMARVTERNSNPAEARQSYLQILEQQPTHAGALHRLGVMLVKRDQLEEAMGYFQKALSHARNPTLAAKNRLQNSENQELVTDILGDLGYAHYLAGDLDEAEKQLKLAKNRNPSNERVVNNLALTVGLKGDLEESMSLFRAFGSEAEANANIAFVQTRLGDMQGAKNSYHRALELDPSLKLAANGLLELHQRGAANSQQSDFQKHRATNQNQMALMLVGKPVAEPKPKQQELVFSIDDQEASKHRIPIALQVEQAEVRESPPVVVNTPQLKQAAPAPTFATEIQTVNSDATGDTEGQAVRKITRANMLVPIETDESVMPATLLEPEGIALIIDPWAFTGESKMDKSEHKIPSDKVLDSNKSSRKSNVGQPAKIAPIENDYGKPSVSTLNPVVAEIVSTLEPVAETPSVQKPAIKKDKRPGIDSNDFVPNDN